MAETEYLSVTSPLDGDSAKFGLASISGTEGLSELYAFNLSLGSGDTDIDATKIVGKALCVKILLPNLSTTARYVHGLCSRFTASGDGTAANISYYAEIRPWLWQLQFTRNSRVFQNQKTPEIITSIFDDAGFKDYRNDTKATYAQREYTVQYQESAFDFISRLMEDEGIHYYFEHAADKHTLVLADDSTSATACAQTAEIEPPDSTASWIRPEHVQNTSFENGFTTGKYSLGDYNFKAPAQPLNANAKAASKVGGSLEIYEYPGGFTEKSAGDTIAGLRMDGYEGTAVSFSGGSYARGFTAGYSFKLKKHATKSRNADYLLRRVSIHGSADTYSNSFEASEKKTKFRPLRVTPRPRIPGSQTALVVGPKDEEIYTDEFGRVKIQFHWDREGERDEKSSCWIRVAQMWAGKGWGSLYIPRVGAEVVVSFFDGDPDYPLVTGTVYNATQTVPYKLPDNKVKSTLLSRSTKKGTAGNEICFDDTKDKENFYIHAQKDQNFEVENDQIIHIKNSRQVFVQKDKPSVDVETKDLLQVKGNRKITIQGGDSVESHTNEGEYKHEVSKNFTIQVKGDTLTIEANKDLIIKGKTVTIQSTGGDTTIKSAKHMTLKASMNMTQDAGQNLVVKAGMNGNIKAGMKLEIKGGMKVAIEGGMEVGIKGGMKLEAKGGMMATAEGGMKLSAKGGMMGEFKGGMMSTLQGGVMAKVQGAIAMIN